MLHDMDDDKEATCSPLASGKVQACIITSQCFSYKVLRYIIVDGLIIASDAAHDNVRQVRS